MLALVGVTLSLDLFLISDVRMFLPYVIFNSITETKESPAFSSFLLPFIFLYFFYLSLPIFLSHFLSFVLPFHSLSDFPLYSVPLLFYLVLPSLIFLHRTNRIRKPM
jgi:hypothetical protein